VGDLNLQLIYFWGGFASSQFYLDLGF